MAITPRTVLSQPLHILVLTMGLLAVLALAGIVLGIKNAPQRAARCRAAAASLHKARLQPPPGSVARVSWPSAPPCALDAPDASWTAAQWVRHLGCMEARNTPAQVLLVEVNTAIQVAGLAPELALKKSDYLREVGTLDEQIDFLQTAVRRLGVVDGTLVHRLSRALVWRGDQEDLEQIRHLQHLSMMLQPEDFGARCEVAQTNIWALMMMAQADDARALDSADLTPRAARLNVHRVVRDYVDQGCAQQIHRGQWADLAEVVGVAIAAEATSGQNARSSLVRKVSEAFRIQDVPEFCRTAVPDGLDLRETCEKRVGDELYLAR